MKKLFNKEKKETNCGGKVDTMGAKEFVTLELIRNGKVIEKRHSDKITTTGLAEITQLFGGGGTAFTAIALGTGTTAAAAGNTALEAEITSGTDLERAGVTPTYTVATAVLEHTFTMTADSTVAVTEEGEFNAMADGVMAARQVFAALNVTKNDEIKVTHNNAFAEG